MLIIILLLIAVAVIGYFLWKRGDQDGDGDIDLKDIKLSAKDIKEDIEEGVDEIKDRVEDVIEELGDVVSVIKGVPTKGQLNKLTKQQLVDSAKADHGVDLDIKVKKSTLVNKVYSLYR